MSEEALSHCCQSLVVNPGTMDEVQAEREADDGSHLTSSYGFLLLQSHNSNACLSCVKHTQFKSIDQIFHWCKILLLSEFTGTTRDLRRSGLYTG